MNSNDALGGFETRLLTQLRAVVEEVSRQASMTPRPQRRRGRAVALAATIAIAALAIVTAPALVGTRLATPAFAVRTLADGRVHVVVEEHYDDPDRLERALRDKGVAVERVPVPASPSMVGRLGHVFVPDGADGIEILNDSPGHVWEFIVDAERFTGTITLEVGAPAERDQRHELLADAFAKGEPLHGLPCAAGWPIDAAVLDEAAQRAGLRIEWHVISSFEHDGWTSSHAMRRPTGDVFNAVTTARGLLEVTILPSDMEPEGVPAERWPDEEGHTQECTPELARRWQH
jgi:hypothetical protein